MSNSKRGNSKRSQVREIYDRLMRVYGPQGWWPGETGVEVVVGAILTQNTAWTNVERAIQRLKAADVLDWSKLHALGEDELAELIRPAGTFRVKAARLKGFVRRVCEEFNGSLDAMLDGNVEDARLRLLSISGVGPETADAILLYAGEKITFVVDAYTKRILRRHGLVDQETDYETIRRMFLDALPRDVQVYNEYHALLVAVGKEHCRTRAECDGCPLADMPHDETL